MQASTKVSTEEASAVTDSAGAISADELDRFIQTLENENQRKQFVDNLKALNQVQSGSVEENPLAIADALLPEETAGRLVDKYGELLDAVGISASSAGKLLVTLVALSLIGVFVWLNGRIAKNFDRKFGRVRRALGLHRRRFSSYFQMQVFAGYAIAGLLALYTLSLVFNRTFGVVLDDDSLVSAAEVVFSILLVILIFSSIWEIINGVIEHYTRKNQGAVTARVRTLIPLIRNALLFFLTVLSLLVVLSEIGIDVMPLLAGAGVLGIAVGFGAQTLVKDFLTGFTILIEDLLQVDDVVTVGGRTGIVEKITLRKVEMRSLDGTVHTVPFSEISIVDNLTKDFSYYMLEVGVAYRENTDEVIACLEEIDRELRADEEFGRYILDPLEVLGVDRFDDSAVVIKARTRTRAHEKWLVGREFNRRIKLAFDARNIEIPFPHQTLYFGESKGGQPTSADIRLVSADPSQEKVESRSVQQGAGEVRKRVQGSAARDTAMPEAHDQQDT
uniref:mechanosensitive ion channel family protein n=1 Tax=Microbulbifer agarilyticus TaxID=260552 RepID=UPI00130370B5|nr:mechanosensitive ion channel family protein [Microbulbifer agarilyticus]